MHEDEQAGCAMGLATYNHGKATSEIGVELTSNMSSEAEFVVLAVKFTILDCVPEKGSVDSFVDVRFPLALVCFGSFVHGSPVGLAVGKESLLDPSG